MNVHADRKSAHRVYDDASPSHIVQLSETRQRQDPGGHEEPHVLYPLVQVHPLDLRPFLVSHVTDGRLVDEVQPVMNDRERYHDDYENLEEQAYEIGPVQRKGKIRV